MIAWEKMLGHLESGESVNGKGEGGGHGQEERAEKDEVDVYDAMPSMPMCVRLERARLGLGFGKIHRATVNGKI